jgi:hypothetical protein
MSWLERSRIIYEGISGGFFAEYLYVLYLLMKDRPIVTYKGEVCIDETRHAILLFLKNSLMTYQGTENPILELGFLR